eukprot:gene13838-29435_t
MQIIYLLFSFLAILSITSCQDLLSKDELSKLSGKALKKMLQERGQDCKGCSEKQDFVEKVFGVQSLPIIETPKPKDSTHSDPKESKENVEDIMEMLNKAGFGGKVYTPKDFEKFAKMDPPPRRKSKKADKTVKSEQPIEDDEKIEL